MQTLVKLTKACICKCVRK